jgi:hypothetical protein
MKNSAKKSRAPAPDDKFLTTEEAAKRLKRSVKTLEYWRTAGLGAPYYRQQRSVRYLLSEVLAWGARCRVDCQTAGGLAERAPLAEAAEGQAGDARVENLPQAAAALEEVAETPEPEEARPEYRMMPGRFPPQRVAGGEWRYVTRMRSKKRVSGSDRGQNISKACV